MRDVSKYKKIRQYSIMKIEIARHNCTSNLHDFWTNISWLDYFNIRWGFSLRVLLLNAIPRNNFMILRSSMKPTTRVINDLIVWSPALNMAAILSVIVTTFPTGRARAEKGVVFDQRIYQVGDKSKWDRRDHLSRPKLTMLSVSSDLWHEASLRSVPGPIYDWSNTG